MYCRVSLALLGVKLMADLIEFEHTSSDWAGRMQAAVQTVAGLRGLERRTLNLAPAQDSSRVE